MAKKFRTREATEENLKKLYANNPHDKLTLEEAITVWGRNSFESEKNRMWFSTLLGNLKHYNLVKAKYVLRNSRNVLEGVELTNEGKRVLKREEGIESNQDLNMTMRNNQIKEIDIMKMIAEYKRIHPEFDVNIDIKLKENWEDFITR